ncbi:hypothetical protein [Bacillus cereus]|uniref:hypothetical protein n=1 Tax=Bacillus cereus TaxID=1396 RepID=UPI0035CA64CA
MSLRKAKNYCTYPAILAVNTSEFNDKTSHSGGNLATGIVIENEKIVKSNHEINEPAIEAGLTKHSYLINKNYTSQQLLYGIAPHRYQAKKYKYLQNEKMDSFM